MTIREMISAVLKGTIRIPAFQRGFVWDPEMVAFLMDSIYKKYPIGSILFWRTRAALSHERNLGPFSLLERDPDYPIDYTLDGQQRLTSLFGVFQTELTPDPNSDWLKIYFDYSLATDAQEAQFFALEARDVYPEKHFDINTFFDTVAYRKATKDFSDEIATKIDEVQAVFKEARLPIETITTEDKTKVAIIFERINRQGVPLDTLQLLTAWTWSEEFDLQEQFSDLAEDLEPFGFEQIGADANLLLRCCAAILANNISTQSLMELNGTLVRDCFGQVTNGVKGAIDFLRTHFNVYSLNNLPFSSLIVPLSVFYAVDRGAEVRMTADQRSQIERWFWRSCFSKRYSSGVLRKLQTDIGEMLSLKKGKPSGLGEFDLQIQPDYFFNNVFRINTANSKSFVLLLAQNSPRSFISGSPISIKNTLKEYNRSEFHHLMPRLFLRETSQDQFNDSVLSNFCFLSRTDNNQLGGTAPSGYRAQMPADIEDVLSSALCPRSLFEDNYVNFIQERSQLLSNKAKELCQLNEVD